MAFRKHFIVTITIIITIPLSFGHSEMNHRGREKQLGWTVEFEREKTSQRGTPKEHVCKVGQKTNIFPATGLKG